MNKLKALRSPVLVAAAFALACLIGPKYDSPERKFYRDGLGGRPCEWFRNGTLPDPPSLVQGITPAFAPTEVFEEFERYAKLFHESFGGR